MYNIMDYPPLVSDFSYVVNIPIFQTWRYKQRLRTRQILSLTDIHQRCRDQDVHPVHKDICLQDLVRYIHQEHERLVKQRYELVALTYSYGLPVDVAHCICDHTPQIYT